MSNFSHFFSIYTLWLTIPTFAIVGIIFWLKQKTKASLILSSGTVMIAIGYLIQTFSPFGKMTIDQAGKIISYGGPPVTWYTGSIITSIGLIVTVIGFALVTWKIQKTT